MAADRNPFQAFDDMTDEAAGKRNGRPDYVFGSDAFNRGARAGQAEMEHEQARLGVGTGSPLYGGGGASGGTLSRSSKPRPHISVVAMVIGICVFGAGVFLNPVEAPQAFAWGAVIFTLGAAWTALRIASRHKLLVLALGSVLLWWMLTR